MAAMRFNIPSDLEDPGILCFQHCQKDVNILCMTLPRACPLCHSSVEQTPMKIPPFRLPSPLSSSKDSPISVVVKPTEGTFIRHYSRDSNLHIGLTNSQGDVYDYDENGVHTSRAGWSGCLCISLAHKFNKGWADMWDQRLAQFCQQPQWTAHRYSEVSHNCYDFVLTFLRHMEMEQHYPCVQSRSQFVQDLVVPKTAQVAKYISLHRRLATEHVITQSGNKLMTRF